MTEDDRLQDTPDEGELHVVLLFCMLMWTSMLWTSNTDCSSKNLLDTLFTLRGDTNCVTKQNNHVFNKVIHTRTYL